MLFVNLSKYRHLFCNFASVCSHIGYKMKKFLIFFLAAMLPVMVSAQAQINTKKIKIADFTQKVTKVILTGNSFYDGALQEEVSARWRVSPYEFCSLKDFEGLKGSDKYYFLMITQGQFGKESEPGIQFMTLIKGGQEAAKGIDSMLEVVTVPFAAADIPSGRELTFLPILLDIIQDYTLESMKRDLNNLGGLSSYTAGINKTTDMAIHFAEEDLNSEVLESIDYLKQFSKVTIDEADTVDELVEVNAPNTLVSYTVAPSDPQQGSFCYKMLIVTQDHKLYFFRKHRIGKTLASGFLPEDIKRITAFRPKNK